MKRERHGSEKLLGSCIKMHAGDTDTGADVSDNLAEVRLSTISLIQAGIMHYFPIKLI